MLLEDFLKSAEGDVRSYYMEGADPEGSREYYEDYFVMQYFNFGIDFSDGTVGNLGIPEEVERMNQGTYIVTYNKTGKMAVFQHYVPNGMNMVYYLIFSEKTSWICTSASNHNMRKFLETVTIRPNRKMDRLLHKNSAKRTDILIQGKEVITPAEGFSVNYFTAVEYKTLEYSPTLIKARMKWVTNGVEKRNEMVTITLQDEHPVMTCEPVEEDWWGLKLPDYRFPFFSIASPYNKIIHEHLIQPEYAGDSLWIGGIMSYGDNHKIMVRVADKWIPIPNLEDWEIAGVVSEQAAQEYQLYKSLFSK